LPQFFWFEVSDPRYAFSVLCYSNFGLEHSRVHAHANAGDIGDPRKVALLRRGCCPADCDRGRLGGPDRSFVAGSDRRMAGCQRLGADQDYRLQWPPLGLWGVVSWEIYPDVDSHNPDSSKRSRPTLGMPILLEMAQTRTNQWDGQIYNAEDGNTYSANISLVSSNILRVQGCFLGILCGGENWTRVNPPNTNHAPPSPNSAGAPTSNLLETDKHVCLRLVGPSGLPPESGRGYR
jgi:Uncharacterized protein conserved in bacteria (DUF2147)